MTIDLVFGFVLGVLITMTLLEKFFDIRVKNPYRWVCPKASCTFKISSTDRTLVEQFATDHRRESHAE